MTSRNSDAVAEGDRTSIFNAPLKEAAACAMSYLSGLDQGPVGAPADAATLRSRIAKPLSRHGISAEQVVRELAADVDGGLHSTSGGRFFA